MSKYLMVGEKSTILSMSIGKHHCEPLVPYQKSTEHYYENSIMAPEISTSS